jgi:hypothetical protein
MQTNVNLAVARFESAIAVYPLDFPQIRDPRVENYRFPAMTREYWSRVRDGLPPQQAEFAEAIAAQLPELPREAVIARACRSYPAFVRQHHFELLLKQQFDLVLRGDVVDHMGIDFLIVHQGRAYEVDLSVGTRSAAEWSVVKNRRHPKVPNLPVYRIEAGRGSRRVGRFWLHDARDVERLKAEIKRTSTGNTEGAGACRAEARRQSLIVATSPGAKEDQDFIDAISDWPSEFFDE